MNRFFILLILGEISASYAARALDNEYKNPMANCIHGYYLAQERALKERNYKAFKENSNLLNNYVDCIIKTIHLIPPEEYRRLGEENRYILSKYEKERTTFFGRIKKQNVFERLNNEPYLKKKNNNQVPEQEFQRIILLQEAQNLNKRREEEQKRQRQEEQRRKEEKENAAASKIQKAFKKFKAYKAAKAANPSHAAEEWIVNFPSNECDVSAYIARRFIASGLVQDAHTFNKKFVIEKGKTGSFSERIYLIKNRGKKDIAFVLKELKARKSSYYPNEVLSLRDIHKNSAIGHLPLDSKIRWTFPEAIYEDRNTGHHFVLLHGAKGDSMGSVWGKSNVYQAKGIAAAFGKGLIELHRDITLNSHKEKLIKEKKADYKELLKAKKEQFRLSDIHSFPHGDLGPQNVFFDTKKFYFIDTSTAALHLKKPVSIEAIIREDAMRFFMPFMANNKFTSYEWKEILDAFTDGCQHALPHDKTVKKEVVTILQRKFADLQEWKKRGFKNFQGASENFINIHGCGVDDWASYQRYSDNPMRYNEIFRHFQPQSHIVAPSSGAYRQKFFAPRNWSKIF